jgi:Domain of unknown function (DUF4365)
MDSNKQKEQFSIAFIRVLAAVAGVYVQEPKDDIESEDLVLAAKRAGSPRLAVQAKCSAHLEIGTEDFPFELRIEDYDNLRSTNTCLPRILIVVEVPAGEPQAAWIDHKETECCMRRSAYWMSLHGYRSLPNRTSVTIRIPLRQKLTVNSILDMMGKVAVGDRNFES